MKTVADVVAEELRAAGVDRVFGLPGGEVLYFMDALRRHGIDFVLCRHEANAGIAAAVYGKLRGRPGVVVTTLGPGAANLMLAVTNSLLDREPLLAICADIPASWPAAHTHQRLPLREMYAPVTKLTAALHPFSARTTVRSAVEACMREPMGPVLLTLSAEDALRPFIDTGDAGGVASQGGAAGTAGAGDLTGTADADAVVDELRRRLAEAERPLVLVGLGTRPEQAPWIRQWIKSWGLPVTVTPKVKGIVDETDDCFVGVAGGMAVDALMLEAIEGADLLVGIGFDPVEVDKLWHAQREVLNVIDAPLALDVVPNRALITRDLTAVLQRLADTPAPRAWNDPFAGVRRRRRALYEESTAGAGATPLSRRPVAIVRALAEVLPPETIVTTDVGSHKYLFGQFWPSREPGTFWMSNGLSGMGYGLAAALGARLARPESPVLAAVGDGGFSMNSQELETARRAGAPLVVVVLADRSLSLIRISQSNKKLPRFGVDFEPIDSVKVAESCGVEGVRALDERQLADAAQRAVREGRTVVIEVPVEVEAYHGIV